MATRAINLDWLELYCLESGLQPMTASFFESLGYKVNKRDYGTPIYREMFTILKDGKDWIEVRRDPYSKKGEGGFLHPLSCHIRMANEFLYTDSPIDEMRAFLIAHDFKYKSISRIDICMDFNEFDESLKVKDFIQKYVEGNISKINQSRLQLHGEDNWTKRTWNSFKWGAPTSAFSTKLYNKSMELRQGKDKPYIKQAWLDAGLNIAKDVWRIEFSTSSQAQTRVSKRENEAFRLHITHYDNRHKLLMRFAELYEKYFDFRLVEKIKQEDGSYKLKRKDRCKRPTLLNLQAIDVEYKPSRNMTVKARPDRVYKILINKLQNIIDDETLEREYKDAFRTLVYYLSYKCNFEIKQVKIKETEELLKLEPYKQYLSKLEQELMWNAREEREKNLCLYLMKKYHPTVLIRDDLPF